MGAEAVLFAESVLAGVTCAQDVVLSRILRIFRISHKILQQRSNCLPWNDDSGGSAGICASPTDSPYLRRWQAQTVAYVFPNVRYGFGHNPIVTRRIAQYQDIHHPTRRPFDCTCTLGRNVPRLKLCSLLRDVLYSLYKTFAGF